MRRVERMGLKMGCEVWLWGRRKCEKINNEGWKRKRKMVGEILASLLAVFYTNPSLASYLSLLQYHHLTSISASDYTRVPRHSATPYFQRFKLFFLLKKRKKKKKIKKLFFFLNIIFLPFFTTRTHMWLGWTCKCREVCVIYEVISVRVFV